MGLDMYLKARKSLYTFSNSEKDKQEKSLNEQIRDMFPEMFETGNLDNVEVGFECGYWRKANHIHKWFVDNCQEGVDDCREAYVSRDKLIKLRDICRAVIKHSILKKTKIKNGYTLNEYGEKGWNYVDGEIITNPEYAKNHLPTQEGFFFGSEEYDSGYINDIEHTIDIINKCLELPEDWYFYYHSSW